MLQSGSKDNSSGSHVLNTRMIFCFYLGQCTMYNAPIIIKPCFHTCIFGKFKFSFFYPQSCRMIVTTTTVYVVKFSENNSKIYMYMYVYKIFINSCIPKDILYIFLKSPNMYIFMPRKTFFSEIFQHKFGLSN